MLHAVDGLVFETPFGFQHESTTVALAAGAPDGAPRPNLVIHRQAAGPGATLAACEARVARELGASIPGLVGLTASDLLFDDGQVGRLLAYAFPSTGRGGARGGGRAGRTVRQLTALRLDGGTLTTITLTTAPDGVGEPAAAAPEHRNALASARLAAGRAAPGPAQAQ